MSYTLDRFIPGAAFTDVLARTRAALQAEGFGIPVEPDGAFYVYLDCGAFSDDSSRFAIDMLEQAGVAMVPGEDFGRNEPGRWLRLSYATATPQLHEAVERLRRWLPARSR